MKKVLVLMSTFNGEKYVKAQIDSIMKQKGVDVTLAIRDDCSNDATPQILTKLKNRYKGKIILELGKKNLFPKSFTELYKITDLDGYDYYSFSDHDDVWLEDKLLAAVTELDKQDTLAPLLYFSNLTVTDENLNPKFDVYGKNKIKSTYNSCFVDFCASANTFVFNKKALDYFMDGNQKDFFFGDVWQQFLIYFVGKVIYDEKSHILFRRTGNNVSGSRERGWKLFLKRIKKIKKEKENNLHIHREMAKTILDNYPEYLDEDKKTVLTSIAFYDKSLRNKLSLIFSRKIKSKSFTKNVCFIGRILLNLL